MREVIVGKLVGNSVKRTEDPRLLTGTGRFVDDVTVPNMAHAAFLRSPMPHAEITRIDTTAAKRSPGVIAIFTGTEIAEFTNPFVGLMPLPGMYDPTFYSLAVDRVRHVGDPVALVIADSRRAAEDGAELVEVDYRELEPISTIGQALDSMRAPIWPKAKSNVMVSMNQPSGPAVGPIFADADRTFTQRFVQHRQSNQPMETRGIVVEIRSEGPAIVHAATQSSHALKWALAMMSGRLTVPGSIKEMFKHRDRPKLFVNGAKSLMAAKPEMKGAGKPMMPTMMKQMASDPKRAMDLQRSMVALLAKGQDSRPEVVAQDIGGAFGAKGTVGREDVAVYAAAVHLQRSIKWIEDRNENLMVGGHARDENVELSMACDHDGTIRGMHVRLDMNIGAYPAFPFGGGMFSQIIRVMMPGPYRVPALQFDTRIVASNKGTYVAYRGPWAVETWVRERMLDIMARNLGISRADIRRRNMITAAELPTKMITGPALDVRMSAAVTFEKAMEVAEFDLWAARQAEARANGKIVGMGFATFIEAAPGPPGFFDQVMPGAGSMAASEPAHVVLESDGTVSVYIQQMPHGQSHETTFAQVAADELGVPMEQIRVRYGDTRVTPFSLFGTGGSRAGAMTGGVVTFGSRELRGRILDIAADLLEASLDDLVVTNGNVHVAGTPARSVDFAAIAAEAKRTPQPAGAVAPKAGEAIRIQSEYDGGEGGWAQSTHVCWVEIDLETGVVKITRYVVAEDCGELINPAIVEGQVRGGVAQGIGAVLYEKITYNESGQFQTGTFLDYLIPTTMEIPEIEIHHIETPSTIEANYRGVGEGGMIAAPAALTNAIEDALAHLGVIITEQHLPPSRILELAGVITP